MHDLIGGIAEIPFHGGNRELLILAHPAAVELLHGLHLVRHERQRRETLHSFCEPMNQQIGALAFDRLWVSQREARRSCEGVALDKKLLAIVQRAERNGA